MGFGLCVLGYLMTVFDTFAGGVVGWPLLAIGFWKLQRINKSFRYASVFSVLCLGFTAVDLMVMLELVESESELYFWFHMSYVILGAAIHLVYLLSVKSVADEGGDKKIALHALSWLFFSEIYYICSAVSAIILYKSGTPQSYASQVLGNVVVIMKYVIGFTNIGFLYTCYAKITTDVQIEKDRETFRKIAEKEEEKKNKRRSKDDD